MYWKAEIITFPMHTMLTQQPFKFLFNHEKCIKKYQARSYVFLKNMFLGHFSVNFHPILKIFGTIMIYDFIDPFSKRNHLKYFYSRQQRTLKFLSKKHKKIFVAVSIIRDRQPKQDRSLFTYPTYYIKNIFIFSKILASGGQKRYPPEGFP